MSMYIIFIALNAEPIMCEVTVIIIKWKKLWKKKKNNNCATKKKIIIIYKIEYNIKSNKRFK